ncbi:MAG: DUF58 domain-containing protein [Pseudomonadota bacterium]
MEAEEGRVPSLFTLWLVLFFVGLLLFISLLHAERDLAILAFLVLGLAGGAKLWSRLSLKGLRCSFTLDKGKVFPGEELTFSAKAENAKFLPVWLQITLPLNGPITPSSGETTLTHEGGLLWHQRVRFQWGLTARRRGVHAVGPPQIRVADPLGFFPRLRQQGAASQVLVYPRLIPLKPFSLPRRELFGLPGSKSPVQDPVYILGTRDYQHGRPARHIHWKASARHDRLQEKVFEPTEQEKVLVLVDVHPFEAHKASEAFEETLEAVASLTVDLDRRGYAVSLATNGVIHGGGSGIIPPTRNSHHLPDILELLARLEMRQTGDLTDTLLRGLDIPRGVTPVHFSYEASGVMAQVEEYFTRRKTPVVFFVWRVPSAEEGEGAGVRSRILTLDEICLRRT